MISRLIGGETLLGAATTARELLASEPRQGGTLAAIDAALALATSGATPSSALVETLGSGWTGEEALAIALYCAVIARDFAHGVLLAMNHSGDSDSTGSIAGNILGVLPGAGSIPAAWLATLELCAEIERLAADLWQHFGAVVRPDRAADFARYPGS